jgi:hypothetical protein
MSTCSAHLRREKIAAALLRKQAEERAVVAEAHRRARHNTVGGAAEGGEDGVVVDPEVYWGALPAHNRHLHRKVGAAAATSANKINCSVVGGAKSSLLAQKSLLDAPSKELSVPSLTGSLLDVTKMLMNQQSISLSNEDGGSTLVEQIRMENKKKMLKRKQDPWHIRIRNSPENISKFNALRKLLGEQRRRHTLAMRDKEWSMLRKGRQQHERGVSESMSKG